jgi:hypothetical protein
VYNQELKRYMQYMQQQGVSMLFLGCVVVDATTATELYNTEQQMCTVMLPMLLRI